jgi:hypothetical protein
MNVKLLGQRKLAFFKIGNKHILSSLDFKLFSNYP